MRRALLLTFATITLACTSKQSSEPERAPAAAPARSSSGLLARVRASDRALARFGKFAKTKVADVALPRTAAEPLRVGPVGDPSRALLIRPLDLAAVPPKTVEDAIVFEAAAQATDVLVARDEAGAEEIRVLADASAPSVFRWELRIGDALKDVRLRGASVEAVDEKGKVVVRSGRFFAVDARGVRRDASLSLAREADAWILTATLATEGLAYPIVVDPVWLGGPAMSSPRADHVAAVAPDGKIWLACGYDSSVEVFDPSTDSFAPAGELETYLYDCAMTFGADGRPRLLGGGASYLYDPTTKTWTAGATTGFRQSNAWAVLPDGKVLAIGGSDSGGPYSKGVEVFDPATDTWSPTGSTATAHDAGAIAVLPGGKVMLAGGYDGDGDIAGVEIYDPVAKTWSAAASLPEERSGGVAVVVSGKVLVVGGVGPTGPLTSTAIYDLAAGTWAAGPSISVARRSRGATATADGRVFVLGGTLSGEGDALDLVEVADPALTAFTATRALNVGRYDMTINPLADGRIFVAGGRLGFGDTTSTELLSSFKNGASCTWNGECASSFCASGVCCESACTSECRRCNLAGSLGTCAAAPSTTSCGTAPGCSGASITGLGKCSGTDDNCVGATATACAGGLVCADATSCLTKCTKDADCVLKRCDVATGLCVPPAPDAGPDTATPDTGVVEDTGVAPVAPKPEGSPKVLGTAAPCTSPSECESGFCVDGVCCDSECKDRCHSCALPSTPGRCTEAPLGVDLRNECGAALSCSGTCGKGGVCTTSVEGSQCAPSKCTSETGGVGAAYCSAQGVPCPTEETTPFDCGAYICDPAFGACRTSCSSSDACAPGYVCDTGSKSCVAVSIADDGGCAVSNVGARRSVTSLVGLAVALGLVRRIRARRASIRRGG